MFDNVYAKRFATFNVVTPPSVLLNIPKYEVPEITYPEELFNYTEPSVTEPNEEITTVVETPKRKFKKKKAQDTATYDHTISFQLLCKNIGIDVTVTSELRPGAKTKSGKSSNHGLTDELGRSRAIDVVPKDGDFEGFKNKLLNSPEARNWFAKRGYGIINEIIPQVKSKTGATGDHFHIGPDSWALRVWNQWLLNPSIKATQFIS